jgi:hypothetical protein
LKKAGEEGGSFTPLIDCIKLKQIKRERVTHAIAKSGSETWARNPSKKLQIYRKLMVDHIIDRYGMPMVAHTLRSSTVTQ